MRTLVQNLRVGANWRSVIGPLAKAVVLHKEGMRVPKAQLDAAAMAASQAFHVSCSVHSCVSLSLSCFNVSPATWQGLAGHDRVHAGQFCQVHLSRVHSLHGTQSRPSTRGACHVY